MEMIPPTWEQPDRIRILWTVNHHMRWAQTLNRLSKGNFLFNRKIQDCSHKFISLAGRDEYDRIIFHQIFEAMTYSNDFLLYHSASEKKNLATDKYGLNGVLQGTQEKRVEPFVDSNALEDNFPKLMPEFSKAEVAIVLTNWCLHEPNALSEKDAQTEYQSTLMATPAELRAAAVVVIASGMARATVGIRNADRRSVRGGGDPILRALPLLHFSPVSSITTLSSHSP